MTVSASRRPGLSRRPRGDDGTVLVLVLGFTGVLVGLLILVADVSVVLLAQRGVASEADGAAVAGAQQLDESVFYGSGLARCVPLDEGKVQAAVARYEQASRTPTQLVASTPDGHTVEVTAVRQVSLPFGKYVTDGSVTVRSVARATSPVAGATTC